MVTKLAIMAVDKKLYWKEMADYDLETAEAMFTTGRWLYVGFMCHQVIEKILKSYWCATQPTDPPYIHNLKRLSEGSGLESIMTEEQLEFMAQMMPLNIEARYPSYKEELMSALPPERCKEIIEQTKALKQWIENKL